MVAVNSSVRTVTKKTISQEQSRTAPASAEMARPIAWKATGAVEAWRDGVLSRVWQENMHPLNTALSAAADAVANGPEKYGHSIREKGRSELSKGD
jgi:hypothetical protein